MDKRKDKDKREQSLELFARCASGFEKVLAQELRGMRMRSVRPLVGGVAFFGRKADAYEACLWSRVATRIQLVVARVDARDAQALYDGVRGVRWEEHVRRGATIAVRAHGTNGALRNTAFTALKVKDALCDQLRDAWGTRPDVDAHEPDLEVDVALHEQRATLYLNLSGESLHRRGYRADGVQTAAPLKETLASSMLLAAGWDKLARAGASFVDPMCGSGTLAIEAALIACDAAPGLLRERWGHADWAQHDAELWEETRRRARERRQAPAALTRILAGDVDQGAVEIARQNVARAGVADVVTVFCDDAARLGKHLRTLHKSGARGLLACNPPYGERLQAPTELAGTYHALAQAIEALPDGWRVAAISPDARIDTTLGRDATLAVPCHNGPLDTWFRTYELSDEARTCDVVSLGGKSLHIAIADPHSTQFAARLRKVSRDRARWARKQGVCAYRVYESDLPDYALSVDVFRPDDKDEAPSALVCELTRAKSTDTLVALRHLADAEAIVAGVLDLPDGHVLVRPFAAASPRKRTRDASTSPAATPAPIVREGDVRVAVELAHPDRTLPLVLRGVRSRCAGLAHDKRVACVFATDVVGIVSLAAARPASLDVVEADPRRRGFVSDCLSLNGLAGKTARFEKSDPATWARTAAHAGRRYDLIVCVAPEWLGKRENGGHEWDLSRDHVGLVRDLSRLLAKDGLIVFATTQQAASFGEHTLASAGLHVRDLTSDVLPQDFAHTRLPLRCFELMAQNAGPTRQARQKRANTRR